MESRSGRRWLPEVVSRFPAFTILVVIGMLLPFQLFLIEHEVEALHMLLAALGMLLVVLVLKAALLAVVDEICGLGQSIAFPGVFSGACALAVAVALACFGVVASAYLPGFPPWRWLAVVVLLTAASLWFSLYIFLLALRLMAAAARKRSG